MSIQILEAGPQHIKYAEQICEAMAEAAAQRGTGIAKRQPEYIKGKLGEGKAVIALEGDKLAGFSYIETWTHAKFIANSGLIVLPDYRKHGLATKIKTAIFKLSRKKYPNAKIFGITTSLPVMKINSQLGYKPVTFSELTQDEDFWKGCKSCKNHDILERNERKMCLCTGMLYDPDRESKMAKLGQKFNSIKEYLNSKDKDKNKDQSKDQSKTSFKTAEKNEKESSLSL